MKKTNRQIFEDFPHETYFKAVERAAKTFRDITQHPDSLGFDDESNGFLALHRRHAPSGFAQEIPVCVFLKRRGFGVLLAEEFPHRKSADAKIDGVAFEIKQVAFAMNFSRAVLHQFRTAYHKCDNILLHIAQPVSSVVLRSTLIAGFKTYPSVKLVWVVFKKELYQIDRKTARSGKINLK